MAETGTSVSAADRAAMAEISRHAAWGHPCVAVRGVPGGRPRVQRLVRAGLVEPVDAAQRETLPSWAFVRLTVAGRALVAT